MYFLNNLFECIFLKNNRSSFYLGKVEGMYLNFTEIEEIAVKVLSVEGAGEFVLLIAKKQPNNINKVFLAS